jgi:hypothetical protein
MTFLAGGGSFFFPLARIAVLAGDPEFFAVDAVAEIPRAGDRL